MTIIDVQIPATISFIDRGTTIGMNYPFTIAVDVTFDVADPNIYYVKFTDTGTNHRRIADGRVSLINKTLSAEKTKYTAQAVLTVSSSNTDQAADTFNISASLYHSTDPSSDGTPDATTAKATTYGLIDLGKPLSELLAIKQPYAAATTPVPALTTAFTATQTVNASFTLPQGVKVGAGKTLTVDVEITPTQAGTITVLDSLALTTGATPTQQISTPIGQYYWIKYDSAKNVGNIYVASDHVTELAIRPLESVHSFAALFTGTSTSEVLYPVAYPPDAVFGNMVSVRAGQSTINIAINDQQSFTDIVLLQGTMMVMIVNGTTFTNQQIFSPDMPTIVPVPVTAFDTTPMNLNSVQYIFINQQTGRVISSAPPFDGFQVIIAGYQNQPPPGVTRKFMAPTLKPDPRGDFLIWDFVTTNNGVDVLVPRAVDATAANIKVNIYFNGWNVDGNPHNNSLLDQSVTDAQDNEPYTYHITKDKLTDYGQEPGASGVYSTMKIEYYTTQNGNKIYSEFATYYLDTD